MSNQTEIKKKDILEVLPFSTQLCFVWDLVEEMLCISHRTRAGFNTDRKINFGNRNLGQYYLRGGSYCRLFETIRWNTQNAFIFAMVMLHSCQITQTAHLFRVIRNLYQDYSAHFQINHLFHKFYKKTLYETTNRITSLVCHQRLLVHRIRS